MPPDELQIVLDENLPWSIATQLKARGYGATSNYILDASGTKDPEWLQIVASLIPPSVLVTFDNAMPIEHGERLHDLAVTLAVIVATNRPTGRTLEQYWREVVHRHAHLIAAQEPGSWWRYRQGGRRKIFG